MANLNPLGRKLHAVIVQPPGSDVLRRAVMHADDDVAIPRPGVVAVIFAWARRMVGMRMIPSDHFETLLASGLFRRQDVYRGHRKAVTRRIVTPIDERKELQYLARGRERATTPIVLTDAAGIPSNRPSTPFPPL